MTSAAGGSRVSGRVLLVAGAIGLSAAMTLTIERFEILADPGYRPSCSINPVLSCGSVMTTEQAAVFGFPNPLLGIVGFTIVALTGVLLAGGVTVPRWYRVGLWLGTVAGVAFVHWLIFQSLYRIGALCPYCMVVWAVTIATFAIATRLLEIRNRPVAAVVEWRWTATALWFALLALLVYLRFQDYWDSLL